MSYQTRAGPLKRGILLFWSIWISIVVLMNVGDALKVLGILPAGWKLASGNYRAIVHETASFGIPRLIDLFLLIGVIVWETLAAGLFFRAVRRFHNAQARRYQAVYVAFGSLLALFGAFILVDEIFHSYTNEGDHRGIALLLLASLLAMQLLPERTNA